MESLWTTAAASFKTEGWRQAASCDNHKNVMSKTSNKPFKDTAAPFAFAGPKHTQESD